MKEKVLIIFMKQPKLGEVKTRLAKDIGDDRALLVYKLLLEKCRAESLKLDAHHCLYYHETIADSDEWANDEFSKFLQLDGDLGTKMSSAIYEQLNRREDASVVLIGSDCYDLNHHIINEAFEALKFTDLVLGPANDGGYYLIGMNNLYQEVFENIDWSTDKVLKQTICKSEKLKLNYLLLEELVDLDTFDDLKKSGFPEDII